MKNAVNKKSLSRLFASILTLTLLCTLLSGVPFASAEAGTDTAAQNDGQSVSSQLLCGAAIKDITPTPEMYPLMRKAAGDLVGVIDPLRVRCIALNDGSKTSLVLSFETGRGPYAPQFAAALAEHTGVDIDAIFFCATHSHAAPEITAKIDLGGTDNYAKWGRLVMAQMLAAADEAIAAMKPAVVGIGYSESYTNVNRNATFTRTDGTTYRALGYNGGGFSDKTLTAIQFSSADTGKPIAFIISHPTHGVVMHANEYFDDKYEGVNFTADQKYATGVLGVSSDLPGYVSSYLEAKYEGSVALWLCGAAGDQNALVMNEMYTANPLTGEQETSHIAGGDVDILKYLAKIQFADVLTALSTIKEFNADVKLSSAFGGIDVPGRNGGAAVKMHLLVLRIGDIALVGNAGELFSSIGVYMREHSLLKDTIIINCCWNHAEQTVSYWTDDDGLINGGNGTSAKYEIGYINDRMTTLMNDLIKETEIEWDYSGDGTATSRKTGETVIVGLDGIAGTGDDDIVVSPAGNALLENIQVQFDNNNVPCVALGNGFDLYPGADGKIGTEDDVVKGFGSYAQSDKTGQVKDPLNWRLLDIKDNKAVIMTDVLVDSIQFNLKGTDSNQWKDSNIRSWMNSTGGTNASGDTVGFYNTAFSADEKAKIALTNVNMNGNTAFLAYNRTKSADWWEYYTDAGENTSDYVWTLSGEEAFGYFGLSKIATFEQLGHDPKNYTNGYFVPSDYAYAKGVKINTGGNGAAFVGFGDSWTRSQGRGKDDSGNQYGVFWGSTGSLNSGRPVNTAYGALPVVTVKLSADALTPGATVKADPASPTGYTATFVYKNSEATSVYLQGDAMYFADASFYNTGKLYTPYEWQKGMFPISGVQAIPATGTTPAIPATPKYNVAMTKTGSDTWTVTVPLPSGAYKYCYYVNGNGSPSNGTKVLDPANLPLQNPNTGAYANFSIVYMPFDAEKQNDDRSVTLPRDGQNGMLKFETITGNIGGQTRTAQIVVYLPFGYDEARAEPYKVLYISHGGGGHERDWTNDGTMPNIMDNMIAEGRLEPTIVVALSYNGLGGTDATLPALMAELQKNYIVPLVESKYNASTKAADRAFAGLSQGGLMTSFMMVDACKDPENKLQYGTYGIWSAKSVPTAELEALKDDAGFMAELRKLKIIVDTGFEDKKHYDNSVALVKKLDEIGAGVYARPTYVSGGHDWMLWPKLLESFAENLWMDSGIKTGVASDGSGTWEYDSAYGYFEMGKSTIKNSVTTPGPEEVRVRDYASGGSTLSLNYGDGLFVRMFTDNGPGTKTVDGKTISTVARDSFYTLYCGTTDRQVGEEFYPDASEKIGGRMLDKKLRDVHSFSNFCYQGYDTGGGKLGVDDGEYGQIYVYVLTENFDKAYARQQAEAAGTSKKAEYGPEDYPDKYYLYGDATPPNGTNTTLGAGATSSGRNVIIAKFPIKMSKSDMELYWTVNAQNAAENGKTLAVGEEFNLGIHTQIKSTWGWDADGWNKFVDYQFTSDNPDIIDFTEIDPNFPVAGNPLNPVVSGKVTAKKAGVATVHVKVWPNTAKERPGGYGLFEETTSTFTVTVTDAATPAITSVTRTETLVSGYAANVKLIVNGTGLDSKTVTARIFGSAPVALVPGAASTVSFTKEQVPSVAATTQVPIEFYIDGVRVFVSGQDYITVEPKNDNIWTVQLDKSVEGKTRFLFAADISTLKGYKVTVNGGPSFVPVQDGNALVIDYAAASGDTFVISGVKYAKLFPSYSFTFTVK